MKKITLLFMLFLGIHSYGQLFEIASCSNGGSSNYGPMYSTAVVNATNRTAVIYPASQLAGIAGNNLNGAYFKRSTASGTMAGTPNFKIYLKETSSIDWGSGAVDWAVISTGATLVYDSNPASSVGADAGWKNFAFTTNFLYSGTQNLAVFFEYTNDTASTSIAWNYEFNSPCIVTTNNNTTKYSNNTSGTLPSSLTTSEYRRPLIGFDFVVSCPSPTGFSFSNLTNSSVNLNWVAGGAETSWEYAVLPSTNPVPTSGTSIGANSVIAAAVSPNTSYTAYVRAICGAADNSVWKTVSFVTPCVPITDFIENFESWPTGTGNLPDCWRKLGTSANVYNTTGSVAPMSPAKRLYLNSGTGLSALAILPPVSNLSSSTHKLKFTAYATAADKYLEVGYLTNALDASTFVLIESLLMPSTVASTAQTFTVVPLLIPSGATNLVFRNQPAVGTSTIYIDDVKWEVNSSCVEPSALSANNITTDTAQLGWTGGPETEWSIQYGLQNFQLGTGTIVPSVTTNPYVINGLTQNTVYHFYVRAICTGNINSSWTGPFTFSTPCASVTDFIENFESWPTGTGNLPACWSKLGTSANVYTTTGSVAPMSPAKRLYLNSGTGQSALAILPPVSNLPAETHRLRFTAYATAADKYLDLGYLTTPSDVNSFVLLESLLMPSTTATTAQIFTIIPYSVPSGVTNLVFRNQPAVGTATIYIDDVKWEVNSSCVEPSALSANMITTGTAQLGWTAAGPETEWTIQYGLQGFTLGTGTIVSNVMTNPHLISGLSSNTAYQFYVRAVCAGAINSSWSGPFSFRTLCTAVTAFSENFDSSPTGTGNLPDCWSSIGTATTVYNTTGSVAPMSPSNKLYLYAGTGLNAVAALPTVSNLSAGTHRLVFRAYATAIDKMLEVGYLTDGSDASSFVLIQSILMPSTVVANAQVFTVIPVSIPAGAVRLALRNQPATGTSVIYIDDVKWEAVPSCVEPTNIVVSNVTTTSATVTWTASFTPPAMGYEYYYSTTNTAPTAGAVPTGAVAAGVTTVNLTGLTLSSTYYLWVRSKCTGSDSSVWSPVVSFITPCNPYTIPYFEGFETGYTQDVAIAGCLTQASITGTNDWAANTSLTTYNRTPRTGVWNAYLRYGNEDWLFIPISLVAGTNYTVSFYARQDGATAANSTMAVSYGTEGTVAGMTNAIVAATGIINGNYQQITGIFTPATSGVFYVGIKGYMNSTPWYISLDDISIDVSPTCLAPLGLAINNLTSTSATLTWAASSTPPALGYEYYYSTINTAPTAGTVPTGAVAAGVTTANLTGLSVATTYYVWVRSKCTVSDSSSWSVLFSFTTNCTVATVPYTQDFESSIVPAMPICTSIGNAGTGNNWETASNPGYGFTSKVLRYTYNTTNAANAWFYTQAITLTAGTSYNIAYKYGNNSTTYVEKLKVAYGMTATSAGMTTVLADHPSITGGTTTSTATSNMVSFTPTVSGEYYFGFNAYSIADQYYLFVDDIAITTTLGTDSFDNTNFSYYPNPVKNTLNLSYTQNISYVAVYNLLGQQVIAKTINANQSQIDMSHLSSGAYMVKVTADNQVKMIKVIKE
ncbi:fibronectin type III domain-containing protein [Flavobacterium sp.]|uniref:fibronectin type III domain-containing protein n=1 Tax=Flavobacterium sp. TaxID=239 RepID=UPI002B4B4CFC|nr:fibronectin type III domain-containing protein [Flavobacterium sp.]HLF51770.1 fibronectin type III domain-containing protein [Flavobacterium sp.]